MLKSFTNVVAGIFLAGCSIVGVRNSAEAGYTVIEQHGDIEIRQYAPMLMAETLVQADYSDSGSIGFKRLAGFIFGNNRSREKIAMTAPVYRQQEGEKIAMTAPVLQQESAGGWRMAFVMPAEYTPESLPLPLDPLIEIRQVTGKKVAVIRYSGSLSADIIQQKAEALSQWLTQQGIKMLSPARSAAYDPPWTIPALRRNEVHIDIE